MLRLRVVLQSALRRREGSWWRGAEEGGRLLLGEEGEGRLRESLGRREQKQQGEGERGAAVLQKRGMGHGGRSRASWRCLRGGRWVAC